MSELRASFLLNLGELLVIGDRYSEDDINGVQTIYSSGELEAIVSDPRDVIIHKFCARKNTGEQPCDDDVPVVVTLNGGEVRAGIAGVSFSFSLNDSLIGELYRVATWKPDLEALIKMQDEHDKKLATPKPKRTKTEVDARPSPFPYVSAVDFDLINEYGCELPTPSNKLTIYKVSGIGVLRFGDIVTEDTICLVSDYHGCIVDMMEHGGAELFEMYQKADKTELEPAKPRTKTEYVKVDVSAASNYHTNELFFQYGEEKIEPLKEVDAAFFIINQHKLVRKVERELTWQDEVIGLYDDGVTFNTTLRELIDMNSEVVINISHLVASMTDNK